MEKKQLIPFYPSYNIKLIQALENGSPLEIALRFSRLHCNLFAYYQKLGLVHDYFINSNEGFADDDISFTITKITNSTIYNNSSNIFNYPIVLESNSTRDKFFTMIIQNYKGNNDYRKEAEKIYNFMLDCDEAIVKNVIFHTQNIRLAADKKNGRDSKPSEWYLEHTLPNYFKTQTPQNQINIYKENSNNMPAITTQEPIKIEFVDPFANQDRLIEMENKVVEKVNGKGNA